MSPAEHPAPRSAADPAAQVAQVAQVARPAAPATQPAAPSKGRSAPCAAVLALGDDALVLAQRLSEWAGRAPTLEEDVALTNIALDLLGQARFLLSLAGDEDELAFLRDERDFRNVQLVEQPCGDFAHTIARQLYFSCYQELLYRELATAATTDERGDERAAGAAAGTGRTRELATLATLAALAAKAVKEVAYHRDHAVQWTLRLGDGTEESHTRMQQALDALWRHTGELFQPLEGLPVDLPALRGEWLETVQRVLRHATLRLPTGPDRTAWAAGGGRQGVHTEPFGRMLAEMQHLHRSHPGAKW